MAAIGGDVKRSWLLALYPKAWRKRYGEEFLALLEETPLSPRAVADCLFGALDARLRPQVPDRPDEPAAAEASRPVELPPDLRRLRLSKTGQWERHLDRIVGDAIRRGDFADLPGAGKPLDLDDNPFVGEWGLAYKIVKDAGETLPWIALGNEVDADKARLRAQLARAADDLRALRERGDRPPHDAERERLRPLYLAAAARLDRKLADLTIQIPHWRFDRGRLPPHVANRRFDEACPPWEE
jgi:DnaJ family protein C protein 28